MDNFNKIQSQPYYNSNGLNELEWDQQNDKAISMQNKIKALYEAHPGVPITPYMVQDYLSMQMTKNPNLNSVRRSISNLKNDLVIEKLIGKTRIGKEGLPEHYYVLRGTNSEILEAAELYKKGKLSAGDIALGLITNNKVHFDNDSFIGS